MLVTNWHCLTGINPYSGKHLDKKNGAEPNRIRINHLTNRVGSVYNLTVPLYEIEGSARWRVHPTAGEQVDVAALNLATPEKSAADFGVDLLTRPLNEIAFTTLSLSVGDELFVVGYPRNLHLMQTAIWKRATIASEPSLFRDRPQFRRQLIDCATREGMSGSPVVAIHRGFHKTLDQTNALIAGDAMDFFGIYSGRTVDVDEDPRFDDLIAAQIGIVWPRSLVERVVSQGVPDKFRRGEGFCMTEEG